MRHAKRSQRLSRPLTSRKSLLRHLVSGLVKHERITTTFARAKETQRLADRLVTWGKDGSLAARREVFTVLQDRTLTKRLFADVAPLFQDRRGGYTRVMRLQTRRGDGAQLALLEFVAHTAVVSPPKPAAKPKKKTAAPASTKAEAAQEPRKEQAHDRAAAASAPGAASGAAAATPEAPAPADVSKQKPDAAKPKGFLAGLRGAWRRKKTDE